MSLVGDALRRARAEAGERRGVAIPPGLGPPIRRSLFGGPVVVVLAFVAVAAGAALVTWRLVGGSDRTPAEVTAAAPAGDEPVSNVTRAHARSAVPESAAAPEAGPSKTSPTVVDAHAATAATPPASAPELSTPAAPATGEGVAEPATAPVQSTGPSVAASPPPHAPSHPAAAERSFVIDAELGYTRLHLDYLVYKRSAPFARVNGRDVIVGSIIDGFKVEEIGPDFVRLTDSRGPVTLRVR